MITEPRVFEDDYPPRRLLHREREVKQILRAWAAVPRGVAGEDVLLHGPSGVGKSALARHALRQLDQEAPVASAWVRSLGKTSAGIGRSLLRDLGVDVASNTPTDQLWTTLQERVDAEAPVVAVLDEGDDLPATDALERLADIRGLSTVAIVHDPDDWLARCSPGVRERYHGHDVGLERYGVDELADILEARADVGLRAGVVDREQLERLADKVAGVARDGIQSLKWAARQAHEREHDRVQEADLKDGPKLARQAIREANLQSLPYHHQVLYELVRECGPITAEALHERYDEVAGGVYDGCPQTPVTRRRRRTMLAKLVDYGLVDVDGENRGRMYRVCDGNIKPMVNASAILN